MGSLMAGWDSPFEDPKTAACQRNKSFTNEEIEAYWRSKKKVEEEHHKASSSPSDHAQDLYTFGDAGRVEYKRSSSLPVRNDGKEGNFMEMDAAAWDKGWWTRSNWAFLNEPPVFEGTTNSYASQFHVAGVRPAKPNNGAGSSP